MSLRQFEYLLAVVEQQSFTAAAQALHVTQSGLSQQIQTLERSVGVPLLDRLPRRVRLTAAGEQFVRHAKIAVDAERRAFEAMEEFRTGRSGRIDIATVYSVTVGLLPGVLAEWTAAHPGVTVRIHEFQHRTLLEEAARAGTVDLAIGPEPEQWMGPSRHLGDESFVLVLSHNSPIAAEISPYGDQTARPARSVGRLPLTSLRSHEWVMLTVMPGLVDHVSVHLAAAGITDPHVVLRTSQMDAAARMAAAGLGVALLPEHAVAPKLDAIICEPEPKLQRSMAVFSQMALSVTAQSLVDRALELPWNRQAIVG